MNKKPVSLQEFKNWLSDQKDLGKSFTIRREEIDNPDEMYIGSKCRSKVCEKKLLEKIDTEEDPESVVREFLENGGSVIAVDGKKFQIEVDCGTFMIPRFCIKIKK